MRAFSTADSAPIIERIRKAVIGDHQLIKTVFGEKPLIYADHTASGRSLDIIENFIRQQVLPYYANTHTEASYTGAQTTALREQARQQIKNAVNACEKDSVIFCGSGATAAIHKLIDILNLRLPAELNQRYQLEQQIAFKERPVVFIGAYEHHSNELPWRESIAHLVSIPLDKQGCLDLTVLDQQLQKYAGRSMKIGCFSAASNVTGIKTKVEAITRLLHRHGALSFWDYAAAAPYMSIDMTGTVNRRGNSSKDAVFISPHKFIGGPGSPGVLVVKRHLLNNRVPATPGGGTVCYVTPDDHRYIDASERREEGGTPAIVESIRAGLVFKLQQDVGIKVIEQREEALIERALCRWSAQHNIEILGNPNVPRLSIISLRIKYKKSYLHYNFVVALLNDLFGIQSRGGCSCAGPYAHQLLGMDMDYSRAIEAQLLNQQTILRPGWIRINFNYFIDEATFDYLLSAVEMVAEHGWRLLPFYQYDAECGLWCYQGIKMQLTSHLSDFNLNAQDNGLPPQEKIATSHSLPVQLSAAQRELLRTDRPAQRYRLELPEDAERLRWFVAPQEISQ